MLAIFVIYVMLGVLYESFIHPITILSGLPFAAFGALVTLMHLQASISSVYGFVGIIMLIGIVEEERDHDDRLRDRGGARAKSSRRPRRSSRRRAIRFRPIMMTTMAALMGTLPIALSDGARVRESRRPLGVAVVGGLAFSQLVTLYVTPVVYTYMDTANHRMTTWFSRFSKKRDDGVHVPVPAGVSAGSTGAVAMEGRVTASSEGAAD